MLFGVNGSVAADLLESIPAGNTAQIRSVLAALILGAWRIVGGPPVTVAACSDWRAWGRAGDGHGFVLHRHRPVGGRPGSDDPIHRADPGSWLAASGPPSDRARLGLGGGSRGADRRRDGEPGLGRRRPRSAGLAAAAVASITFAAYLLGSGYLGRFLPDAVGGGLRIRLLGDLSSRGVSGAAAPGRTQGAPGSLGWLVILGTVVPFLFEVDALKMTDAGTVGVVATLEPVVAAAVAWIWLGQRLTAWQVVGGVIVVAAIAVVQYFTGGEGEPTPIG